MEDPVISELNMSEKFCEFVSYFSRVISKIYSIHSQFIKDLTKYAFRVGKRMRSFYMMRFTGLRPQLAAALFRMPKIEEELIINLGFELLKVRLSRSFLRFMNISKTLSDIGSKLDESAYFIYEKSPVFKAVTPIAASFSIPAAQRVYTKYPEAAGVIPYNYADMMRLKRPILIPRIPRIPLTTPQRFYEAGARTFEAVSILKSFSEKWSQHNIGAIEVADRVYTRTEKFHSLLENRLNGLIKLVKSPYQVPLYSVSMKEEISETVTEKTRPTKASIGYYETKGIIYMTHLLSEMAKETFKPIIQRSFAAFVRPYIFARRRRSISSSYGAYIEKIIYSKALSPEPAYFMDLRKTLKSLFYSSTRSLADHTRIFLVPLLSRKARWSGSLYRLHSKLYIRAYRKTRRNEVHAISRMLNKNLLPLLFPKISRSLEIEETEEPSTLLEHTRIFFEVTAYPLASQLFSSKVEYLRPVIDFFGRIVELSRIFPLTEPPMTERFVGFKEAISGGLLYPAENYPTVGHFAHEIKPVTSHMIKLTEYLRFMEKSLDTVSPLTSSVKAIFGTILPLKFDLERFVKWVSEGLTAHIYPAMSKPLLGAQTPYGGRVTSFQLLRMHEVASILQMFSSIPPPSSERVRVQRPINITVRVESPADEGDLRELERKIVRILREEARRYGLNI